MANLYAFRHGQRELQKFAVDSATVIAIGDMLFLDTDDVKPAADFTWDTDLATTQGGFAAVFVGIAASPSASGDTDDVDVDVSPQSVYDYPCASASFVNGATLGPDKASGNALLSQTLETAVAAASICRAVEHKASATTLMVQFAPAKTVLGANVNANVG